jgi:hypothetical protein
MTNDEVAAKSVFVIRAASLIRHSSFVNRHSTASQDRQ